MTPIEEKLIAFYGDLPSGNETEIPPRIFQPTSPIFYYESDGVITIAVENPEIPTRKLLKDYLPEKNLDHGRVLQFRPKKRRIALSGKCHKVA